MSDNSESVIYLIDTLCNRLSENLLSPEISKLSKIRKNFIKQSKINIWTALLNSNQINFENSKEINGLNRVSYYVYELKENDQIAKSNRLQNLVDMFTGDQCIPEFNYIRALEFLIVFKQSDKETQDDSKRKTISDSINSLNFHTKLIEDKIELPLNVLRKFDSDTSSWKIRNMKCDENFLEYGVGDSDVKNVFSGMFNINNKENMNFAERINHDTLFSALISKPTRADSGIDNFNLDIPDLPDDKNMLQWQIPKTANFEWIDYHGLMLAKNRDDFDLPEINSEVKSLHDDEGFSSPKSSNIDLVANKDEQILSDEKEIVNNAWENALKLSISEYVDWEMRDQNKILVYKPEDAHKIKSFEKFLLIDSPRNMFDQFYYYYLNTINILYDKQTLGESGRILIDEKQYIIDCLNVLLSLPSGCFIWDETYFFFNDSIHISGVSCEALNSYSTEYSTTGTYHRRLLDFLKIPDVNIECGSVFRSFINALKVLIRHYNNEIIETLGDLAELTFVSMYSRFKSHMDQIKFLAELCNLTNEDFKASTNKNVPNGIDLIFYLFKFSKKMSHNTLNYTLLLHLFSKTIIPFLSFIESWIFHGEFIDPCDEFIIDLNYNWQNTRDQNYLSKAYKLKTKYQRAKLDEEEDENIFESLYEEIFNCGKNLALLKICDPMHFLCRNRESHPNIEICYNLSELKKVDNCQEYKNLIFQSFPNKFKTRKEIIEETEIKNQELLVKMQNEAAEKFQKFEEKLREDKRLEKDKKRKIYDSLNLQMEDELKRKADEKEKKLKEEKEYIENLVSKEERQKKVEIESRVRKELEDKYQTLTKQAESRETVAKAKIEQAKRTLNQLQPDTARYQVNTESTDIISAEIKANKFKTINKHGHASDSQLKDIIYANGKNSNESNNNDFIPEESDLKKAIDPLPLTSDPKDNSSIDLMEVDNATNEIINSNNDIEMMDCDQSFNDFKEEVKEPICLDEMRSTPIRANVSDQSTEKIYRSGIKMNVSANKMSNQTDSVKKSIKFNDSLHHSNETNQEKLEKIQQKRLEMFRYINLYGHASDSQVQQIMYNLDQKGKVLHDYSHDTSQIEIDEKLRVEKFNKFTDKDTRIDLIGFEDIIIPYETSFEFNENIYKKLLTRSLENQIQRKINITNEFYNYKIKSLEMFKTRDSTVEFFKEKDIYVRNEAYEYKVSKDPLYSFNYLHLGEILKRSLTQPIQMQSEIINKSLLNYFLFDLNLEENLAALRMYMLCENAQFSGTLIDNLCENILFSSNQKSSFLFSNPLNPIFVTEALDKAVSSIKKCNYVENFSIRLDCESENSKHVMTAKKSPVQKQVLLFLKCLELNYKVNWPLNIIITEKCFESYNKIFKFLLQNKLIMSAINNIWNQLKLYEITSKGGRSEQLRHLKLFSHEMQHYVSGLQSYIYNQVIQVAWQNLQKSLNEVTSLDELVKAHEHYIEYALKRCFLVKGAEPITNSIQAIFQLILKFRIQLAGAQFLKTETNEYKHEGYQNMMDTYNDFKGHSLFLYTVLEKFISKSHEFHVHNLSLTLNYNFYYSKENTRTEDDNC